MGFASWQRYCTASSSGRQPNFAALNRWRHLCSAGRPSRWALAHISSCVYDCVPVIGLITVWEAQHSYLTITGIAVTVKVYLQTDRDRLMSSFPGQPG